MLPVIFRAVRDGKPDIAFDLMKRVSDYVAALTRMIFLCLALVFLQKARVELGITWESDPLVYASFLITDAVLRLLTLLIGFAFMGYTVIVIGRRLYSPTDMPFSALALLIEAGKWAGLVVLGISGTAVLMVVSVALSRIGLQGVGL